MRAKTMKRPKNTVKFNLDGHIYDKNGIELGEYHYSLFNDCFSWRLYDFNEAHNFWKKQELLEHAQQNGWTLQ